MKTLLIICCLFSLTATAQVQIKTTTTTQNITFTPKSIGMAGVQDSLKIAYQIINDLKNEIIKLKKDTTYFSKKTFKGKGTIGDPLEVVK